MPITFERNICCNFDETIAREWFLTNGLGGYAAGTIAGTLTRMQHGLLVAALPEETIPQLLLAKIDEEVLFDQRTFYLGTNEYQDGTLNPAGFVHLESFRLEDGFPIFTYRLGGIDGVTLEKRIWMLHGQNTTCIQYRVIRNFLPQTDIEHAPWHSSSRMSHHGYLRSHSYMEATQPSLILTLLPFVTHRPYDQPHYGGTEGQFQVYPYDLAQHADEAFSPRQGMAGCTIHVKDKATPFHILACGNPGDSTNSPQFIPTGVWYWHFLRRHDQAAGLPSTDDLYLPGVLRARLLPEQALTILVTTEELTPQHFEPRYIHHLSEQAVAYQHGLLTPQSYFGEGGGAIQSLPVLPFTASLGPAIASEEFLQLLYQAADHFLIQRTLPPQERGGAPDFFLHLTEHIPIILPNYYQIGDHTREALIALPGLTIATRHYSEAQRILRTLSRYFRQGLLPDRLPTAQRFRLEDEDYGSVDTSLWYCYALDKYLGATHDYELLDELYPRLAESLTFYIQGTFHGIQLDPTDGLLRTRASERALTWMNALAQGQPVTPRTGKAVEVNALWYHTLSLMQEWTQMLYQRGRTYASPQQYEELRAMCRRSFNARFWYQDGGHLYDVIDGPEGNDARLRPHQLLAISLRHAVLETHRQATVLDTVTQHLVTPYGLRSLAPYDPAYRGQLPTQHTELPYALHQGSVWPWLVGPYIDTLLKVGTHTPNREQTQSTPHDLYREYVWRKGLQVLEPFRQQMQEQMLGSISGMYAGDAPHTSASLLASAMSVGEILRTYKSLAHLGIQQSGHVISA